MSPSENDLSKDLWALGNAKTEYSFNAPNQGVLERFASPLAQTQSEMGAGYTGTIHIECPEFTSLCPKTGQPDFAKIIIDYMPDKWCVESKSLKLYLMGYRNHGSFHEQCVQQITSDLVKLLDPFMIKVKGEFTPRGGIPFWPTVSWSKERDWIP